MRAYVVAHPEEAFTQVDLPRPAPTAGQVLVRVHASGVNPLDTKIRAGKAAHAKQPLPAVLGLEEFGAITIDYRILSTEQYVAIHTEGQGFR